jgi:hypothetical protein
VTTNIPLSSVNVLIQEYTSSSKYGVVDRKSVLQILYNIIFALFVAVNNALNI